MKIKISFYLSTGFLKEMVNCKDWCRPRIRPTIFSFTEHNQIKWNL